MSVKTKSPKRTADLSEIAFQRLQQAILTGELKEGERVRESRLAAEWKMGITPLREAVRRMAAIGYLILQPNHAPVVRKLTSKDIQEIYALRELLECFALRSCWETILQSDLKRLKTLSAKAGTETNKTQRLQAQLALDTALHQLWMSPENKTWLSSILERLLIYRPNLMKVLVKHPQYVEEAYEEHKMILAALEKRDLDTAIQRLGSHIKKSGTVLAALADQATH